MNILSKLYIISSILRIMAKSLTHVIILSKALKFYDVMDLLRKLEREPLYYKEVVKIFDSSQQRFSDRWKLIKELDIIEKNPIKYDNGRVGVQYELTPRGVLLMKRLHQIDDLFKK